MIALDIFMKINKNSDHEFSIRDCVEIEKFVSGHESKALENDDLYMKLYSRYLPEMPNGIAKARDGDPTEFIGDCLERDFGT